MRRLLSALANLKRKWRENRLETEAWAFQSRARRTTEKLIRGATFPVSLTGSGQYEYPWVGLNPKRGLSPTRLTTTKMAETCSEESSAQLTVCLTNRPHL